LNAPTYLFVAPWPVAEVGGVNQVVLNLYRHCEAAGRFRPMILVTKWDHVKPCARTENGRRVAYMRVRAPHGAGRSLRSLLLWAFFLLPDLVRIARFLRANDVDCVNVHYPSLAAIQFVFARFVSRRRPKIVLSFHGLDIAPAVRAAGIERWMWNILLHRADAIVGCSSAQSESVLAFAPSLGSRISTIHNGVDIGHLARRRNLAARVDPRLRQSAFILCVASYEWKKGLDTLLHALSKLHDAGNRDMMLALAGPDLGAGDELRALAETLGVADRVVFCGEVPHDDLHAYYTAARMMCLPSRCEPFGLVLLEAAAFRCPVVATSVGGIPEILQHGTTACLVPPDDATALASALARTLDDPALARLRADALHEHVKTNFPWDKAYRAYLSVADTGRVADQTPRPALARDARANTHD
jgi:glycosyltransferase involved in cell wall biosynthesis